MASLPEPTHLTGAEDDHRDLWTLVETRSVAWCATGAADEPGLARLDVHVAAHDELVR